MVFKQWAAVVLIALSAVSVRAQEVTLSLGVPVEVGSPGWQAIIAPWIAQIETESKGRIRVVVSDTGSVPVISPPALYDALVEGRVDLAWVQPALTPDRFARISVFELPFLMTEAEPVSRALWEFVSIYAVDEFKDVNVLALHVQDTGVIHSRDKPIRALADLAGLRLQTSGHYLSNLMALLGANPKSMPADEVRDAIASGALDGAVVSWQQVAARRLNEVTRFHAEFDSRSGSLITTMHMLAMNSQRYASLPADLKAIIDRNSGLEVSAAMGRAAQKSAIRIRQLLGAEDTITVLSLPDAEAFRKGSTSVDQAWVKAVTDKGFDGQKLLDGARTLIKKYTK